MTVGELKTCLEAFPDDWIVSTAPDIEITAAIRKGVVFVGEGVLVIERPKENE